MIGDYREPSPVWKDVVVYLGDKFDASLANWGDEKVQAAFDRCPDAETFYRDTDIYIYHGTGYFLSGVKRPYYARLLQLIGQNDLSILDYGCGAGDDGLLFERLGFRVSFADIPSHAFEFLKWRIARWDWRDTQMPDRIYTIGLDEIPRHNLVWCMDVLEHIPTEKQFGFIDELARLGEVVMLNIVLDPKADDRLHYHMDAEAITEYIQSHWTGFVESYHEGRVLLVVYGDGGDALAEVHE